MVVGLGLGISYLLSSEFALYWHWARLWVSVSKPGLWLEGIERDLDLFDIDIGLGCRGLGVGFL